jgi:heterodisulfide reductase subunit A-like polyferredoxin
VGGRFEFFEIFKPFNVRETTRMEYITVPEIKIPVIIEADVFVVGGGTAGVGAAIRAAQNGADTVVIERFGSSGGTTRPMFLCT